MPNHPDMFRQRKNKGLEPFNFDAKNQTPEQQPSKNRNPMTWPYKLSFQSNLNPFNTATESPKLTLQNPGETSSRDHKSSNSQGTQFSYINLSTWWGSTTPRKKALSTGAQIDRPMNSNSINDSNSFKRPRHSDEKKTFSKKSRASFDVKKFRKNEKLQKLKGRTVEMKLPALASTANTSDKTVTECKNTKRVNVGAKPSITVDQVQVTRNDTPINTERSSFERESRVQDNTTTIEQPAFKSKPSLLAREIGMPQSKSTTRLHNNTSTEEFEALASTVSRTSRNLKDQSPKLTSRKGITVSKIKKNNQCNISNIPNPPPVSKTTALKDTFEELLSIPPKLTAESIPKEIFEIGATKDHNIDSQNGAKALASNPSTSDISVEKLASQKDCASTGNQLNFRSSNTDELKEPLQDAVKNNDLGKCQMAAESEKKSASSRTLSSVDSKIYGDKSRMMTQVHLGSFPHDCIDRKQDCENLQRNLIDPIKLNQNDVIRSYNTSSDLFVHNEFFQSLCTLRRKDYLKLENSSKAQTAEEEKKKKEIIQRIIDSISSLDPPGRFIGFHKRTGPCYLLDDQESRRFVGHALHRRNDGDKSVQWQQNDLVEKTTKCATIVSAQTKARKPAPKRTGNRVVRELAPYNAAPLAKNDEKRAADNFAKNSLKDELFGVGGILSPSRPKRQRSTVSFYKPGHACSDPLKSLKKQYREHKSDEVAHSESHKSEIKELSNKTTSQHQKTKEGVAIEHGGSNSTRILRPRLSIPKEKSTTTRSTRIDMTTQYEKRSVSNKKLRRRSKFRLSKEATRRLATNAIVDFLERNESGSYEYKK